MFSLYSLAVTIQTIQSLFRRRGTEEGDLTVAVTRDMRRENKSNLSIFFNHLSFLYFRVNSQDTGTIPVLVDTLKRQLYEQMKDRLPEALVESSMLMRIVPRFALAWGFARFLPASMPTFAFACLGESAYQGEKFAGSQVLNMFHMPRIPPSPGLGIFFSEFRKTLTMTLSYIEDAVSEEEATRLMSTVADQL